MTTVGYGDFYPTTGVGYVAASVVMVLGILITALPIAVIGTHFSVYYEHHEKKMQQKRKLENREKFPPLYTLAKYFLVSDMINKENTLEVINNLEKDDE